MQDESKGKEELIEERFRFLMSSVSDGFFETDGQGVITFANEALARMHGFESPAMLVGRRFVDFVAPSMREEVARDFREGLLADTPPRVRELALVKEDGEVVTVELKPSLIRQPDGAIITQGVLRDITERKRTQEALQNSRERLQLALKSARAGVWELDPVAGRVTLDAQLPAFVGPASGAFPATLDDIYGLVHPDDRERVRTELAAAIKGAEEYDSVFRVVWPDCSVRYVGCRGRIFRDPTGRAVRLLGINLDVTEAKMAEESIWESKKILDELAAAARVGVYRVRNDHLGARLFEYVNQQWCEMNGLSRDTILGNAEQYHELIHPEERDAFVARNRWAREKGERFVWEGRMIINGRERFMHIESWPRKLATGELVWTGVQYDITERNRAEEERRRWEQRLQQARKAESLARMAGAIAHHFNNMLGVVMGNLELALTCGPQEQRLQARLNQAMTATQRAIGISQSMLAYLGQTTGKKEPRDLSAITDEAVTLLQASLPAKVHLRAELSTPGPIVLADAALIAQLLTKLVTNASEALGEQGGEITVAVGVIEVGTIAEATLVPSDWEPQQTRYACLTVSDTGCGLDPANLEKIFDPFFSTKFTGRGLGLPVALGLVRAHGGAITVVSQPGHGARFRVLLPLMMEEPRHGRAQEALSAGQGTASGSPHRAAN